jgi:hypothetical protein
MQYAIRVIPCAGWRNQMEERGNVRHGRLGRG